jgi:hypothetical protein
MFIKLVTSILLKIYKEVIRDRPYPRPKEVIKDRVIKG